MYSTKVSAHVRAAPAAVFAALVDPHAIAQWRVPVGMTSQVHEFDARVGGRFRISLTYDASGAAGKTSERIDVYHGYFAELVSDRRVVEVVEFETADPSLAGTMTMTTTLRAAGDGTDVLVVHAGIPDGVPAADNEAGTRMALANLAALVEATAAPGTLPCPPDEDAS